MLHELAANIWIVERQQRFYGLEVGTRMTVMRLADGSLLLHSPVRLDAALRSALDAIGRVRYAVAPNRVHHLYAGEVAQSYPEVRLWVAPGVERKRPDLKFVGVLGDEAPAEWKDDVGTVFFRGRPYENEVVFFHHPSRTLVILPDGGLSLGPPAKQKPRGVSVSSSVGFDGVTCVLPSVAVAFQVHLKSRGARHECGPRGESRWGSVMPISSRRSRIPF